MGINLGAFIAPLVTGWLGQKINWHNRICRRGRRHVLGLIQYVYGRKYLVAASEEKTPQTAASNRPPRCRRSPYPRGLGRIHGRLDSDSLALIFWAGFEQAGSSLTLFAIGPRV